MKTHHITFLAVLLACFGLTACKQIQEAAQQASNSGGNQGNNTAAATDIRSNRTPDALLADPKVGDLYAAEVSHFSGVGFDQAGGGKRDTAYGLMKVVEVTPDKIIVITEDAAWPNPQGARNDLRGDLSDITWDEEEKIPLYRSELEKLFADGKIIETRRME
ncbi:MAG: hypothetical protein LBV45_11510 [Xanthomonadaceae bacterium]|jgi:hypothetical protein|nr:hypothetical protein [Xanthomonadaceae bacterium]